MRRACRTSRTIGIEGRVIAGSAAAGLPSAPAGRPHRVDSAHRRDHARAAASIIATISITWALSRESINWRIIWSGPTAAGRTNSRDIRVHVRALLPEDHDGQLQCRSRRGRFPFIGGYRVFLGAARPCSGSAASRRFVVSYRKKTRGRGAGGGRAGAVLRGTHASAGGSRGGRKLITGRPGATGAFADGLLARRI